MRTTFVLFSTAFMLALGSGRSSSPIQPRENYGALLEPADRILHGAGQDPDGFLNYWNVMDEGEKPIAYMYYIGLRNIGTTWIDRLKTDLLQYKDHMTVLQIGLELTASGIPYTEDVTRGGLDVDIARLLDGLQEIGLPVYLRIGYEFNGVAWNGYQPVSYRNAFRYITRKVRERDLEIATVWNFAPDGDSNFMAYFPGDDYVDWWAFNPFSTSHLTHPDVFAFLDSAQVHQRPVLIGESTPRYVGTTGGQSSWDQWFEPFFELVHTNPGIKMLSYINWNWAEFPQWSDWGDARLEMNQIVRDHYAAELDSAAYLHAASEVEFRSLLGYNDSLAPDKVTGLTVADTTFPGTLTWDPVSDESGIARYLLYNRGGLYDYTGNAAYSFARGVPGDTMLVAVVAVDRAGNYGPASDELEFIIPSRAENPADQIANGGFELASDPWELVTFVSTAAAEFEIDSTNPIDGIGSGHVSVSATSSTNWHIQLRHPIVVSANKQYVISYSARASQNTTIETWMQQDHTPFEGYAFQSVALTTEVQAFRDTAFVDTDDTVFLTFMVGNSGTPEVWFDNVSVIEEDWEPGPVEPKSLQNGSFEAGLDPWMLNLDGLARASVEIDDSGLIEGQNSARVTISRTTNTNWHVQLRQQLDVKAGAQYIVSYKARASQDTSIETWLQQDHSPYRGYLEKVVGLTTTTQTFVDTATVDTDDTVFLTFMMGNSGLSQIWVDDVTVSEIGVTGTDEARVPLLEGFRLDPPYPNPFNSAARISYEIPRAGRVSVRVYDAVGREVERLVHRRQRSGRYVAEWEAASFASGTYVVRLAVDGVPISSRKLVLVR